MKTKSDSPATIRCLIRLAEEHALQLTKAALAAHNAGNDIHAQALAQGAAREWDRVMDLQAVLRGADWQERARARKVAATERLIAECAPDCPECKTCMRRWNKPRRRRSSGSRSHSLYAKGQLWICPEMERREATAARDEYGRWLRPDGFGHAVPGRLWSEDELVSASQMERLADDFPAACCEGVEHTEFCFGLRKAA